MRRPLRFHVTRSDSKQMAFVLEHPPEFSARRRVVAPVSPPSANAFAAPFGFERGEVFSTNQTTIVEQRQQDQYIGGQMREFAIAPFILLPALLDAYFVVAYLLLPARKMGRQRGMLLRVSLERLLDERVVVLAARLEPVNFAAQTGLSAIDAAGIQEHRATDLSRRLVACALFQHCHREQRPDGPIQP